MILFSYLLLCLCGTITLGLDVLEGISSIKALVPRAKSRIINGHEAVPHSYKYQVGLFINGNSFCGGVLVSPNYVLTAAHCGVEVRSRIEVILGAHNITNVQESTQVSILGKKVIVHANYNNVSYNNDLSLIALNRTVTLNEYIQVAKLPRRSQASSTFFGFSADALGWGLRKDVPFPSTHDLSTVLMEVHVPVMNFTECSEYYNTPNITYVTPQTLCTSGHGNKGTCLGDSGGALILNGTLIGITSFGNDQCEACDPSVFTRVTSFLDWIAVNSDVKIDP